MSLMLWLGTRHSAHTNTIQVPLISATEMGRKATVHTLGDVLASASWALLSCSSSDPSDSSTACFSSTSALDGESRSGSELIRTCNADRSTGTQTQLVSLLKRADVQPAAGDVVQVPSRPLRRQHDRPR